MDYYVNLQKHMTKILIPYSSFNLIRKQLNRIGINHDSIYLDEDEKDYIARRIAEETLSKFKNWLEQGAPLD